MALRRAVIAIACGRTPEWSTLVFANPNTNEKYRKLGFLPDGLFLKLTVGNVSVYAGDHLFKGMALIFESFARRSICQYEVTLPEKCSVEQIAGPIYLNVTQNFRDAKEAFRTHFEKLGDSAVPVILSHLP
jgi:hypothetical protein